MLYKYAEVIVDNKAVETDKPFTYLIPRDMEEFIEIGIRVVVPFGRGNRNIKGIVVDIKDDFSGDYDLKEIIDVLDDKPLVNQDLIDLSKWMKDQYLSSYLDSLRLVLPPGNFKSIETYIELINPDFFDFEEDELLSIISYLKGKSLVKLSKLKSDLNIRFINKYLAYLEELNVIEITIEISTSINKKKERWVRKLCKDKTLEEKRRIVGSAAYKQLEILDFMELKKEVSMEELLKSVETSDSTVKELEKKGLIKIFTKEVTREAIKREILDYEKIKLNSEQKLVLDNILENSSLKFGERNFLIHGITGSGKTEIYLQLVEEMLSRGKDSIILVPEIALTPQTIDRFVGRFGNEVAVLHSALSSGERFDQWRMIREGRVKIAVGARSAVFAPFNNLGLIIIDEEHEDSYKSSHNPKYNTIEVARKRLDYEDGILILGSATPSINTYYRAKKNDLSLLELKKRANKKNLPEIEVVDMREELNQGNKSIFSRSLHDSIVKNLESGRQIILFLNRRGYSSFVSCRSCGYVVKCEECDVSMTYHRRINRLKCHYCGKTDYHPLKCPDCGSEYIKHFGIGTEQVEYITKEIFPKAKVARMDADTMSRKGMYDKTLEKMKAGEIDILIGTQMISKGLDFEDVTLVGIIAADTSLNLPDYRSAEKGFQLITQVAGRAGRGDFLGRVILQTYDPSHYSIECAREHDYKGFYDLEIKIRETFLYPPFINLISILLYGENNNDVGRFINYIYERLVTSMDWIKKEDIYKYVIGPYPSPLEKIKSNYRWQILLKVGDDRMFAVKQILEEVCINNISNLKDRNIRLSIDINPNSIL